MKHMLFFGFGYTARALALRLAPGEWKITGTSRNTDGVAAIARLGFNGVLFDAMRGLPEDVTHVISSVPPDDDGDPVLRRFGTDLAHIAQRIRWAAYLSTTAVYGDHGGAWTDEKTPLTPNTARGARRVAAEAAWLALHEQRKFPLHIFRLAGIYGPGRNQLETVRKGTAQCIIKEGQVFSRIHVEDITGVLLASMARPNPGAVYNVADDEPCAPQDVVSYAAELLGLPSPPAVPFVAAKLSAMARSFYADSKRVSNRRVKEELGYAFRYADYRAGLAALLKAEPAPDK